MDITSINFETLLSVHVEPLLSAVASPLGILAANALLLTGFGFTVFSFLKHMHPSKDESIELLKQAREKESRILAAAQDESARMIKEAAQNASHIVSNAEVIVRNAEQDMKAALSSQLQKEEQKLAGISDEIMAAYRLTLESAKKEYDKTAESAARGIADGAHDAIKEFQAFFTEKTVQYQSVVDQHIKEWHAEARKEIHDYKREAMKKIDDGIYQIVLSVAKQVLGKTISMEEHQALIVRALDEAKKEGFFGL